MTQTKHTNNGDGGGLETPENAQAVSGNQAVTLREALESVIAVHKQAKWDKNLGQYKSEHMCRCGFVFIYDGHNPGDLGATAHMDAHVTEQLVAVFSERERMYKRDLHDKLEVTADMLFSSYEKLADLEKDLEGKYI